jgi:hypothetical protein
MSAAQIIFLVEFASIIPKSRGVLFAQRGHAIKERSGILYFLQRGLQTIKKPFHLSGGGNLNLEKYLLQLKKKG